MLDREIVRRDVGLVLRDVVILSTPFTAENYSPLIVPNKEWSDGWEADLPNWGMTLREVEVKLHQIDANYRVLRVVVADAAETLNKALNEAAELLTEKLMVGQGEY